MQPTRPTPIERFRTTAEQAACAPPCDRERYKRILSTDYDAALAEVSEDLEAASLAALYLAARAFLAGAAD